MCASPTREPVRRTPRPSRAAARTTVPHSRPRRANDFVDFLGDRPRAVMARRGNLPHAPRPFHATRRGDGGAGGWVVDSTTGPPPSGGEVRVPGAGSTVAIAPPDAFGRYVIHTLSAGGYPIEVRSRGYRPATRDVTVGPGDETTA